LRRERNDPDAGIETQVPSPTMTRVTLREVRNDDLATFFEHQSDPEANRMANFPPRDRATFMAHWARILVGSGTERTVEVDGAVAGNVVSWVHNDERDVGYWIGREHWGAGVATAALGAFLTILEERPLFAHVAEHNIGSIRVLEKCGFALVDHVALSDEARTEARKEARTEEGTERLYRLGTDSRSAG
jgi:RimJ/RimL family protein N-acetyltransferase